MIDFFKRYPSKIYTRLCLIIGLIVFIGIYSYILKLFQVFEFSTEEFNSVWLSFDAVQYRGLIQTVIQSDQTTVFKNVFVFNIISITAFMIAFYSLSVMIARHIELTSKLYKVAFIFPAFPFLIAFFDIVPSIFIIATSISTLTIFPDWLAYIMSGGYVIRVILLYLLILWFIISLIWFLIRKLRTLKR